MVSHLAAKSRTLCTKICGYVNPFDHSSVFWHALLQYINDLCFLMFLVFNNKFFKHINSISLPLSQFRVKNTEVQSIHVMNETCTRSFSAPVTFRKL